MAEKVDNEHDEQCNSVSYKGYIMTRNMHGRFHSI